MYLYLEIALLLCPYGLLDVVAFRIWTPPYSERIKLNATFATIIENLLYENKYIPEECTDIRNGMKHFVYSVKDFIQFQSSYIWIIYCHDVSNYLFWLTICFEHQHTCVLYILQSFPSCLTKAYWRRLNWHICCGWDWMRVSYNKHD